MASALRSSDATQALSVRDKVNTLLNAARDGNLELLNKAAQAIGEGQSLAETITAVKDANGRGALHFAARDGRTEICKYLLEDLNLCVDPRDNDGETPLIHATRQGHLQTAKYLLEHGADPATTSNELGTTALHHAAGAGSVELLNLLLSKDVPVDAPSDAGPPLIWAAGTDRPAAVKTLLDHGADVIILSFVIVTAIYSGFACLGGTMFGSSVSSQITLNMPRHLLVTKFALWATVITPMSKYALQLSPVARELENLVASAWKPKPRGRMITRIFIVSFLLFSILAMALALPYFGYVLALTGSFLSITMSIILPCIFYIKITRKTITLPMVLLNVALIVVGFVFSISGTIASAKNLIHSIHSHARN